MFRSFNNDYQNISRFRCTCTMYQPVGNLTSEDPNQINHYLLHIIADRKY